MARWYYRRRGYSRTYRRSRWPYRSWYKTRGVARASTSGTRRTIVRVPFSTDQVFGFPVEAKYSAVTKLRCYSGDSTSTRSVVGLESQPLFVRYSELFDQCRIVSMRLKMTVDSSIVNSGHFLDIVTCVDRDVPDEEQSEHITYHDVLGSSSSEKTTCGYSSRMTAYRKVTARDLSERTTFWDCTVDDRSSAPCINGIRMARNGLRPCFYVCAYKDTAESVEVNIRVRIEGEYMLEFRNPKFLFDPNENRSVKFEEMKKDVVKDVKEDSETVLPDVSEGAKKFDALSAEEKAKIMALVGSMDDES